jgi:hypothetical protein
MLKAAKCGNYRLTDLIKRFMLKNLLSNISTLGVLQIPLSGKARRTEGNFLHENEV